MSHFLIDKKANKNRVEQRSCLIFSSFCCSFCFITRCWNLSGQFSGLTGAGGLVGFRYPGIVSEEVARLAGELEQRERSFRRTVVTKPEKTKTKLFVPTLTGGPEGRVTTQRSQVQTAKMGFLRRGAGFSLRDRILVVFLGGSRSAPPI